MKTEPHYLKETVGCYNTTNLSMPIRQLWLEFLLTVYDMMKQQYAF